MTQEAQPSANPFALMMDPESVFLAIERSERLSRLKSRICRPLDKTSTPAESEAGEDTSFAVDALDDRVGDASEDSMSDDLADVITDLSVLRCNEL